MKFKKEDKLAGIAILDKEEILPINEGRDSKKSSKKKKYKDELERLLSEDPFQTANAICELLFRPRQKK